MPWVWYAGIIVMAYLLGSIPVGYVMGKLFKKIDITRIGSGHTGGTNVLRAVGALPAALTLVGDFAKGYGAVVLTRALLPDVPLNAALAGLFAVIGHNYSLFLGFRGGVGSITTLGATVALMPIVALIVVLVAGLIALIWRYSSLGSLTMAVLSPLTCLVGAIRGDWPASYLVFALGAGLMAFWALRSNIQRLRQGTERRIGQSIPPGRDDV